MPERNMSVAIYTVDNKVLYATGVVELQALSLIVMKVDGTNLVVPRNNLSYYEFKEK